MARLKPVPILQREPYSALPTQAVDVAQLKAAATTAPLLVVRRKAREPIVEIGRREIIRVRQERAPQSAALYHVV